ncbi:MAG: DUF4292 domain-containing protein [Flavobacteriaceae bacterium]|nr:DUF4292 domain-containing protein [Flavobacteriaceae bacterium]
MIKFLKIGIGCLLVLSFGCKSVKTYTSNGALNPKMSSKQLIKAHAKNEFDFSTLQAKVKVNYVQGSKSQTHTLSLRMEKDKTIWISATLAMVRAKITPNKVSFYNKLDNTYFEGDFSLISQLLGTALNFENIQNLLIGQALYDLNDKPYEADVFDTSYLLKPRHQNTVFEIFFLLNPEHFKMNSQQLAEPLKRRLLQIDYKQYQEVKGQMLPQEIKIIAVEDDSETSLNMVFKSVSLNDQLRFPFKIPSGFKEIVIQ